MVRATYIPDTADLVWLDFEPHAGREQAGRRPALILSPASYNERTSLAIACPITSHIKGHPFEVVLPPRLPIRGAILTDHLKSIDWRARLAKRVGKAPLDILEQARLRVALLLGIQ